MKIVQEQGWREPLQHLLNYVQGTYKIRAIFICKRIQEGQIHICLTQLSFVLDLTKAFKEMFTIYLVAEYCNTKIWSLGQGKKQGFWMLIFQSDITFVFNLENYPNFLHSPVNIYTNEQIECTLSSAWIYMRMWELF